MNAKTGNKPATDFGKKLGKQLKDLREYYIYKTGYENKKQSHISLSEIANRIGGISSSTLFDYEKGNKIPGFENAIKLAKFYNVSLDVLAGISDKPLDLDTMSIQRQTHLSKEAIEVLYHAPQYLCDFISVILENNTIEQTLQSFLNDLSRNLLKTKDGDE